MLPLWFTPGRSVPQSGIGVDPYEFMTDTFGIQNRHHVGVERVLWSNDYPHISADWPASWRTIQAAFSGVPPEERHLILAGNSQRLYGFGGA